LNKEKSEGAIRGWSSFNLSDLQLCQTATMSEALKNMNETAYDATKDITDLDEAVAFFDSWQ
jgi:hypothetical protein